MHHVLSATPPANVFLTGNATFEHLYKASEYGFHPLFGGLFLLCSLVQMRFYMTDNKLVYYAQTVNKESEYSVSGSLRAACSLSGARFFSDRNLKFFFGQINHCIKMHSFFSSSFFSSFSFSANNFCIRFNSFVNVRILPSLAELLSFRILFAFDILDIL